MMRAISLIASEIPKLSVCLHQDAWLPLSLHLIGWTWSINLKTELSGPPRPTFSERMD